MTLPPGTRIPIPGNPPGSEAWQHGEVRILITHEEDHGSDGRWRHVSTSCEDRLPTYAELGAVRELYFDPEQTVLQIMPPASAWVNEHAYCLHLWQRLDQHVLPRGLHKTVGVVGSIPRDDREKALLANGHDLAAMLRNQLRPRGHLDVRDALNVMGHLMTGSDKQKREALIRSLEALSAVDEQVQPPRFIGAPWRWKGPAQ